MQNEIVIARYREDLAWVEQIPREFAVTVYNKGPEIVSSAVFKRVDRVVSLENNGRESDTFLRHILNRATLADGFTVFVQGDPFEHSPDFIRLLQASERWVDLQPLSWRWLSSLNLPPQEVLARETAYFVDGARVRPEVFSLINWSPLQFADEGTQRISREYRRIHRLSQSDNIAADFLRRCEYTELAEQADHHLVGRFSYGALFAVQQQLLDAAPQRGLELALEAANSHSMYGYIMERIWLHLFGEPFQLPTITGSAAVRPSEFTLPRFAPTAAPTPRLQRALPAVKRRIAEWAQAS